MAAAGSAWGAASVATQQETNNNPNSQRRYQSGYGLIGSESPHPVHSLSIGLLRSTCRPIHLTAGLRIRVSRNGANGVLKLPAEIACGALNPIFVHSLLLLMCLHQFACGMETVRGVCWFHRRPGLAPAIPTRPIPSIHSPAGSDTGLSQLSETLVIT